MKFENIKDSLKKLAVSGFFDIFTATVINSLVSFVYGIFIVRILSTREYGVFSYVQNITNFGVLFCGFGVNLGILQFCSENIDKSQKYSYSRFAVYSGVISSIVTTIVMVVYTFIDQSNTDNLTNYVLEFSYLPFLYFVKEWITSNLRWQLKNKEYAKVLNVHSVANAVFAVLGAVIAEVHGVIWGICAAYISSIIIGIFYLKKDFLLNIRRAEILSCQLTKKFLKYSVVMCIVNALISVLYTIDLFVVGNVMQNSEKVAMYKTACIIPFALNMVPNSIMTFVYPHVAKNRDDKIWLRKSTKLLYFANGILNSCIGLILYIFAPLIISILFGNRYEGILPVFRILIVSYVLSACLRTPAANMFGILKKTKTALGISIATVLLSVYMSTNLVRKFGIIGAAYSSVCTFGTVGIVSTLVLFFYIYRAPVYELKRKKDV